MFCGGCSTYQSGVKAEVIQQVGNLRCSWLSPPLECSLGWILVQAFRHLYVLAAVPLGSAGSSSASVAEPWEAGAPPAPPQGAPHPEAALPFPAALSQVRLHHVVARPLCSARGPSDHHTTSLAVRECGWAYRPVRGGWVSPSLCHCPAQAHDIGGCPPTSVSGTFPKSSCFV